MLHCLRYHPLALLLFPESSIITDNYERVVLHCLTPI